MADLTFTRYNADPTMKADPDRAPLDEYIADIPGGDLIGDRWLDQEDLVVGVTLSQGSVSLLLGRVIAAYPPLCAPTLTYDSEYGQLIGSMLFRVPKLVADLLEQESNPEEGVVEVLRSGDTPDTSEPGTAGLDMTGGIEPPPIDLERLMQVWDVDAYDEQAGEGPLFDAFERLVHLERLAETTGIVLAELFAAAVRLWDDREQDFYEVADAAAAALSRD